MNYTIKERTQPTELSLHRGGPLALDMLNIHEAVGVCRWACADVCVCKNTTLHIPVLSPTYGECFKGLCHKFVK